MRGFVLSCIFGFAVSILAQVNQPPTDYGNGREGDISQEIPNDPWLSTYGFDDFTQPIDIVLGTTLIYGIELWFPHGTFHLRIVQDANHLHPGTIYADVKHEGGEIMGDWTINETRGIPLTAGYYWLEVWVTRNYQGGGGQVPWIWANSSANGTSGVRGQESKLHNPGGGFGFGTNPFPASQTGLHPPRDNAFQITAIPEPATLLATCIGLATFITCRLQSLRTLM